ncbi:PREDICTED: metalloendoproteinase 5-MMP [Tarenaya hassleriana]|uniref:metalloendoproteinase 5-MMP n=1 Tax=Tarenaya hassleriana TaxID=28532 RepID=UPI00053C7B00|nr:PREDICTED: metalloendoproteinase 5-MMP [Tarenaya hassleriana]
MRFQLLTVLCFLTASPITAKFYLNVTSIPPLQILNATRGAWDYFHKLAGCHAGDRVSGLSKLKQYFRRFGYITTAATGNFTDDFDDVLESAIRIYQKNFDLKVTGELDAATLRQIVLPRCGNSDVIDGSSDMNAGKGFQKTAMTAGAARIRTTKRYSFFPGKPRWPARKRDLIYAFVPQNNLTEDVKRVFSRAFDRWANVTPLRFTRSGSLLRADIVIGFFSGDHGDGEPFDGAMGTLAHASSPPTGMFHLDGDEDWLISDGGGENRRILSVTSLVDLESVAVHEIGHLLGLGHSSVKDAIMYPTIAGGDRKVELAKDDIEGIQHLYGGNPDGTASSENSSRGRETSGGAESFINGGSRWRGLSLLLLVIGFLVL